VSSRIALRPAVAAAAAALLLAACGKGGTSQPAGNLGAPGTTQPASASTAPPAPEPVFHLPPGVRLVFEDDKTGDAVKDAVVADAERLIKAVDQAIGRADPVDPALRTYAVGDGAVAWGSDVRLFKRLGHTVTGTDRYYRWTVTMSTPRRAVVDFCEDQRYVYDQVIKTGKVLKTTPSLNSFLWYGTVFERSPSGVWQNVRRVVKRGAAQCR
jgi:hypothetical protein